MPNCNVQTTATSVLTAGNRNFSVVLQNNSDTNIRFAVGTDPIAELSSTVGVLLEPGDSATLDGKSASEPISAISTGSAGKNLFYTLV